MADQKISALTALGGASIAAGDLFPLDDVSATTTKSIRADEFKNIPSATLGLLKLAAGGDSVTNLGAVSSNTNTVAATGSTETLDVSLYEVHDCTMDQSCTFTFSNWPTSGKFGCFILILRGAFTPTFPTTVKPDGASPTYTTPSVYVFWTVNAGSTVFLKQSGKAFA
jgi:hypothetical protein